MMSAPGASRPTESFRTRRMLARDLAVLGLMPGDMVIVHAAMRGMGQLLNGPDAFIGGLLDAVGPDGTVIAYVDWDARYEELLDADGCVPEPWRAHIPPFDPAASRAIRDNGAFAEFLRTTPGARRSASPGASVAARGARADWITADHPIDYGYGPGSPFAKLVAAGGRVLMAGAPLGTMTLLHHAEHLADIPGKRVKRCEVPFATETGVEWRMVEEYETGEPVVPGLADDYFATIVEEFLAGGEGMTGTIGGAPAALVPADRIVAFAVDWLERRCG